MGILDRRAILCVCSLAKPILERVEKGIHITSPHGRAKANLVPLGGGLEDLWRQGSGPFERQTSANINASWHAGDSCMFEECVRRT